MPAEETDLIAQLHHAQEHFEKGNYQQAIDLYQAIEDKVSGNRQALGIIQTEIGWGYYFLGRYPEAISYLDKVVRNPEVTPQQLFNNLKLLGYAWQQLDNPDKAIAYLQDALGQPIAESEKRRIYFETGKLFHLQDLSDEALPYLEKAEALFAAQADADDYVYVQDTKLYLGYIAHFQGHTARAEGYFESVIAGAKTNEDAAQGYFGLAHLYFHLKDFAEVLIAAEKVISLDAAFSDQETLLYFRCRSFAELEMAEALQQNLPKLLKQYPDGRFKPLYPILKKMMEAM